MYCIGLKGVLDVGVVGVPSERQGEAPRAYIVLKEGAKLTEQVTQIFYIFNFDPNILIYKNINLETVKYV